MSQPVDSISSAMVVQSAALLSNIVPTANYCLRYLVNNLITDGVGDGNGGWYRWNVNDVQTPNGNSIIACTSPGGNWLKCS